MEWITDNIIFLSKLAREHLDVIAMALTAAAVAFVGRFIASWSTDWMNRLHAAVRIPARAVLNLVLFGAIFYFAPQWLGNLLGYFNHYTLAPVLLVITICVGILSEKLGRC
ncbi:DUF3392 family protein [Endozoicomonas sp. ONNA1]|uniref:DUF3392 family protein n=1 Tax=Endozoicomonas sp. ONNA1 TaxID=2828740 RepID=UPI002149161C|nr:DUF3392 family protein [Endozoicomonas sp. ONNA1]